LDKSHQFFKQQLFLKLFRKKKRKIGRRFVWRKTGIEFGSKSLTKIKKKLFLEFGGLGTSSFKKKSIFVVVKKKKILLFIKKLAFDGFYPLVVFKKKTLNTLASTLLERLTNSYQGADISARNSSRYIISENRIATKP